MDLGKELFYLFIIVGGLAFLFYLRKKPWERGEGGCG